MEQLRTGGSEEAAVTELVDTRRWRSRLLDVLLRTVFWLGILVAVPSIGYAASIGEWVIVVVDAIALTVVGVLALTPSIGYRARSIGFLSLAYFLGVFLFVVVGPVAGMYLIAVPVLTAILRGYRSSVVALVVTGLTMVAFGFVPGLEPAIDDDTIDSVGSWLTVTLNFMFVNVMITLSCAALLTRLESSLRISTRLAVAVEQSPNGIVIADPDGSVTYVNANANAYLTAIGSEPHPGRLADALAGAHPELPDVVPPEGWNGTRTVDSEAGAHRSIFDLSVRATVDELGNRSQLVLIIRDVTEERALQEMLTRSEKLQALGTLVGGTAHDFNNALTSIVGLSELLRSELTDPDQVAIVDDVLLASQRAHGVVRQLMSFGKQSRSNGAPTDLTDVLTRALPLFRASVPAHIHLTLDAHPDVMAAIDTVEVHQAVANLVANAAHAMGDDESGTITIGLATVDGESSPLVDDTGHPLPAAVLTVSDTGRGIEAAVLPRIFDPFFTTKPPDEGTGLGLVSVHGMLTAVGGQITIDTEVGRGTLVSLYLPTTPDDARTIASADAAVPAVPPVPEARPTHILLLDDEPAIVTSVSRLLSRRGFEVTALGDPHEALAVLAGDEPIDLVLSDVSMSAMSGIELVRRLRGSRPDLAVILMSGYGESVQPDVRRELGVGSVLDKPFTADQLVARIAETLSAPVPPPD